jgi:hypothetical protein
MGLKRDFCKGCGLKAHRDWKFDEGHGEGPGKGVRKAHGGE